MLQTIQSEKYLKDTCKKIVDVDPTIRFAGVINDKGRLVTGATRDNIRFYVDEREREMLFMEVALRTRMLCEFDSSLGIVNFSIYHRKNVITMEFLLENKTIYVSAEKEMDLNKTPFRILELVKNGNALRSMACENKDVF